MLPQTYDTLRDTYNHFSHQRFYCDNDSSFFVTKIARNTRIERFGCDCTIHRRVLWLRFEIYRKYCDSRSIESVNMANQSAVFRSLRLSRREARVSPLFSLFLSLSYSLHLHYNHNMDVDTASDNTSIDDKIDDFCENPTRDALTEGLMSLLKPTVDQLDDRIRATRWCHFLLLFDPAPIQ